MPWTPSLSIVLSRAIATNLLTYFAANQVDALTWAGGVNLKPIAKFADSTADRTAPVYPAISFLSDNDAVAYGDDLLSAGYNVVFELMIQNPNPNTAITDARIYAKAFVSMIVNCPATSLEVNTGATPRSVVLQSVDTGFDPIKTNDNQTDFMQQFQVRATYTLFAENREG